MEERFLLAKTARKEGFSSWEALGEEVLAPQNRPERKKRASLEMRDEGKMPPGRRRYEMGTRQ